MSAGRWERSSLFWRRNTTRITRNSVGKNRKAWKGSKCGGTKVARDDGRTWKSSKETIFSTTRTTRRTSSISDRPWIKGRFHFARSDVTADWNVLRSDPTHFLNVGQLIPKGTKICKVHHTRTRLIWSHEKIMFGFIIFSSLEKLIYVNVASDSPIATAIST